MMYLIVLIYLAFLSLSFDFLGSKGPKNFFYNFSLIIFILIAGLRWKVGGDSQTYQLKFEDYMLPLSQYNNMDFNAIGWEPGFVFISSLCKSIIDEFWFFQLVQAVFVNVILFAFFKKYTPYRFTALLFYAIFYYFYFNMEILREIIPICVFVKWMYPALESKNYKKYYLINLLLLLFHLSSAILLLFPLLSNLKLNRKRIIYLFVFSISLIFIFLLFPNMLTLMSFHEGIIGKVQIYSQYSLNAKGIILNILLFGLFPYWVITFYLKHSKHIVFDKLIFPYFFIFALYVAYGGFGRFINYFGPFMIVVFVNILYFVNISRRYNDVRLIFLLIIIAGPLAYKAQYYLTDTSKFYRGTTKFNVYFPYSSIINKEEFYFRSIIYEESMKENVESIQ